MGSEKEPAAFSCNCILNYVYAGLEGKRTGTILGPITFGEIAHQFLNQTIVRLYIRDLNIRDLNSLPQGESHIC